MPALNGCTETEIKRSKEADFLNSVELEYRSLRLNSVLTLIKFSIPPILI